MVWIEQAVGNFNLGYDKENCPSKVGEWQVREYCISVSPGWYTKELAQGFKGKNSAKIKYIANEIPL